MTATMSLPRITPGPTLAELRDHAETVPCTYRGPTGPPCPATAAGQPCRHPTIGHILRVPHDVRIKDADYRATQAVACPPPDSPDPDARGCGAHPHTVCVRRDGTPLPPGRHHDSRQRAAGCWREPLDPVRDLSGIRRQMYRGEQIRRGIAERERYRRELQRRRAELRSDQLAGNLTPDEHAEILDIDATLARADADASSADSTEPNPGPTDDDHPDDREQDYRRGPGHAR